MTTRLLILTAEDHYSENHTDFLLRKSKTTTGVSEQLAEQDANRIDTVTVESLLRAKGVVLMRSQFMSVQFVTEVLTQIRGDGFVWKERPNRNGRAQGISCYVGTATRLSPVKVEILWDPNTGILTLSEVGGEEGVRTLTFCAASARDLTRTIALKLA